MHEKYLELKKLILPTMSVLILTSQLCGCSSTNSSEAMALIKNNESIEIEIQEPVNVEEGEQIPYNWTELAYLDTYETLRNKMDDILYIIPMADNGKNGVIYVDTEGNHSNNTCLQDAFNNKKFINNYWNNKEVNQSIIAESKKTFSDLAEEETTTDKQCLLAAYSAYYNLLPSYNPEYANMQSTLSRVEAMSLLYRATNPVNPDLQLSTEFTNKVGESEHNIFAEQIDKSAYTYLTSENNSLDESTATGVMTRAEYVYMLVQAFYSDEYNALTEADIKAFKKSTTFTDLQNAGNVAKEQKYIYTETNKETNQKEEKAYARYQAYELNYCLQHVEDGLTEALYKAYILVSNHNILTDDLETNWELGLTKEYALDLLVNTLEEVGGKVSYDRGESTGEVVLDKETTTESVTENENAESNGQLEVTEEIEQYEEGSYYIKVDNNGNREYSIWLVTDCMGSEEFEGLTEEEVITVLNEKIPDYVIGDSCEDEAIRFELAGLDKSTVYSIVGKELPSSSQTTTTTNSNTNKNSSNNKNNNSNSNSNTTDTTSTNQNTTSTNQNTSQNSNQNNNQQTTPSTEPTVDSNGLINGYYTPEEWAALQPSQSQDGYHTGESWDGAYGR